MKHRPEQPVVLLTGAASGIGQHFLSVQRGRFRFIATDLDEQQLQDQFGGESADFLPCALDVCQAAHWERAIAAGQRKFGRLDYVINNAGILAPAFVLDAGAHHVEQHLDVNAKGVMLGTTLAAQAMKAQGSGGHIINLASLAGIAPVPGLAYYTASKFAVRGFSLAAALELRPHGIFVTAICPDAVQTPMYDLQLGTPREAALTFSGPLRPLSVADVERAILRAMKKKPLEMILPASRGWLAKTAAALPRLSAWLHRSLEQKGLKNVEKIKTRR
jgi:3-oxoacyl-[acyl-carrier protein] reductase